MSEPAPIPRVSPFNALLGIEVEDLESGGCRLTLSPRGEHRNELGSVHGGLITTLLDGAMGRAAGRCRRQVAQRRRSVLAALTDR